MALNPFVSIAANESGEIVTRRVEKLTGVNLETAQIKAPRRTVACAAWSESLNPKPGIARIDYATEVRARSQGEAACALARPRQLRDLLTFPEQCCGS